MRQYRLVILFKSDTKKEKKEKIFADLRKSVTGMKDEKISDLGDKKLSYPIQKQKSGSYMMVEFEAENILSGIDKKILMNDDVLRQILVRMD